MRSTSPGSWLAVGFSFIQSIKALPAPGNDDAQLQRRYDRAAVIEYQPGCDHWAVEVTLGSQVVHLNVDTGSADL